MSRFLRAAVLPIALLFASACEDAPTSSPESTAAIGELGKTASAAPDCECEVGERVFIRQFTVSYPGGEEHCTVWDVCEPLAVCGNLPPDISTAGLFGVFKRRQVCVVEGAPPPFN